MKKGVLIRSIFQTECPSLPYTLSEGMEVYRYEGFTWGALAGNQVAVTYADNPEAEFHGIPANAVKWED